VVAIGGDCIEEFLWVGGKVPMHERFAGLIYQANVHGLGMQVDSTVELVLMFVESHHGPPWQITLGQGDVSRARQNWDTQVSP